MFGIRTDDTDDAVSSDNLALVTDGFHTGSYFHKKSPSEKVYHTIESWQFEAAHNLP